MGREFSRDDYSARIKWLITSRVVITLFLVSTLFFFQQQYQVYSFHAAILLYILITVLALTVLYRYLLSRVANLPLLAHLQIAGDILLVTVFIYLTGGIDSAYSILYHLTIIAGSIILYRRGGYLAASLSSIFYGTLLDLQYYNAAGLIQSQNFTPAQVLLQVVVSILSFYAVAFLSSYLSERLRSTRQELREKSTDFEDLRVLQEHILRNVGSGIVTLDMTGQITSWNPGAEQITGYNISEIKQQWQDVFGTSIKNLFGHTDELKDRPYRFNGEIAKKDGFKALLGITASLLKDDQDVVRGIILIFQDITKIMEMEEQVRQQERLASIGSLAAGIAHEIRNPLASLSGSIQMLQGELQLSGDNKRLMDIVLRETDRLNTIITEFLEYARPKFNQAEAIPLALVLEETVTLFRNSREFPETIRISMELDRSPVIRGDTSRLRQVFLNLLINACQAMPQGGEITMRARLQQQTGSDADWCEIVVADAGEGIAAGNLDRIFDPFFTTKAKGTGLGLAIVYRIITDHGGTISVDSKQGRGTTFTIRLPLVDEAVAAAPTKPSF